MLIINVQCFSVHSFNTTHASIHYDYYEFPHFIKCVLSQVSMVRKALPHIDITGTVHSSTCTSTETGKRRLTFHYIQYEGLTSSSCIQNCLWIG